MTGIVGSVWIMTDNLTDIAWTARTPLAEAAKEIDDPLLTLSWEGQVKKALAADLNVVPSAPDIYGFGKECARLARLALIADELGNPFFFTLLLLLLSCRFDCSHLPLPPCKELVRGIEGRFKGIGTTVGPTSRLVSWEKAVRGGVNE